MTDPESPVPGNLNALSFEELANLADAWADMGQKHNWSEDTRREAQTMAKKLREQAARMRAIMLLRAAREAFDSPPKEENPVILYREVDGVGELAFNDPQRLNAMGEEMAAAMREHVSKLLRARPRALILRGEGRAFSAGGDLAMLERKRHLGHEENRRLMLAFYASFLDLRKLEVPLVAALHGHAVGAGAVLACACDLRVGDPECKIAFPFARLGLHPGMGATYFLPRLVGPGAATELLLTGVSVGAQRALELGLLNSLGGLDEARTLAHQLAKAPRTTLLTLRGDPDELTRALEHEASCQADSYASPEFAEGLRAALEKA